MNKSIILAIIISIVLIGSLVTFRLQSKWNAKQSDPSVSPVNSVTRNPSVLDQEVNSLDQQMQRANNMAVPDF